MKQKTILNLHKKQKLIKKIKLETLENSSNEQIENLLLNHEITTIYSSNDRLNIMIEFHNKGLLTLEDNALIENEEFIDLYRLKNNELENIAIKYDINIENISKIEIIRKIIGKSLFEVTEIKSKTILYHGTHYNLIGDFPYPPAYFSMDILQSVGHIMRDFKELVKAYKTFNNLAVNKKLNDIKCFPTVYVYSFSKNTNLLVLKEPHIEKTFSKLFNPDILTKYIKRQSNSDDIIEGFINKMKAVLQMSPKFFIDKTINEIIKIYNGFCSESCFGGWTNTPGYFLLESIDYNSYLNEIGLLPKYTTINGLYIPRDQDEIVLFGNVFSTISYVKKCYIFPYSCVDSDISECSEFIEKFMKSITSYKKNQTAKLLMDLASYGYEYNIVRDTNDPDLVYEWNFSWFLTDLLYFKSSENHKQKYSYKININDVENRFLNNLTIRSSKISVENIDQMAPYLEKFMNAIINKWNVENFKEFEKMCDMITPASRTFIPNL